MVRGTECSLPINEKVKSNHRYPKILDHERLKMKNKFLRTGSYFKRSKHLLVLKMSSRRLQDITWRSFQYVFRVTILRRRRLQDVLKTFLEDVLNVCPEGVLKACLEHVLKTLWRQAKFLLGISVSNKSKCVSNKSIFRKSVSRSSKANLYFKSEIYTLRIKTSFDWCGVVKSAKFKFDIAEKMRQ